MEWLVRDSAGIQTRNLLIRSEMLYSVELRSQSAKLKKWLRWDSNPEPSDP